MPKHPRFTPDACPLVGFADFAVKAAKVGSEQSKLVRSVPSSIDPGRAQLRPTPVDLCQSRCLGTDHRLPGTRRDLDR